MDQEGHALISATTTLPDRIDGLALPRPRLHQESQDTQKHLQQFMQAYCYVMSSITHSLRHHKVNHLRNYSTPVLGYVQMAVYSPEWRSCGFLAAAPAEDPTSLVQRRTTSPAQKSAVEQTPRIMNTEGAKLESKSFRKRGKRIFASSSSAIGSFWGSKTSSKDKEKQSTQSSAAEVVCENDPPAYFVEDYANSPSRPTFETPLSSDPSGTRQPDRWVHGGDQASPDQALTDMVDSDEDAISGSTPHEFLTRAPDPGWIDIEMVGHWLHKCDTKHGEHCRKPFGFDISGLGAAQWLIDIKRKCLTAAGSGDRYACLSYVWGRAPTLETSKANLHSLLEPGSLTARWYELPKTVRDTIGFVDQLGIPFLWIDSLCIVQDDIDSKHSQIQAMSGVYASSYVTIIAGNGWDANHGLRGIQGVTEPRQLSTFLKNDIRENLQPYSSIWYTRGWTFQEMIFSPRKIMFQYQLGLWECNKASWHESSLSKIHTPLQAAKVNASISPFQNRLKITPCPDVKQYISIASAYVQRKLTYGDDALHAITSLLLTLSTSFPGGFITGLPEMFFDEALLWQAREPMQRRRVTPGQQEIPSWSWVGWEGEIMSIHWIHYFRHLNSNYQDILTLPPNIDIQGGWVRIPRTIPELIDPRHDPLRPVIPAVQWSYGISLSDRTPVLPTGNKHFDLMSSNDLLETPVGWEHRNLGHVFVDNDKASDSPYPIPINYNGNPRSVAAQYLFCRTSRGFLWSDKSWANKSEILLEDGKGSRIGNLNLDLTGSRELQSDGRLMFELVVISAGEITGAAEMQPIYKYDPKSPLGSAPLPGSTSKPVLLINGGAQGGFGYDISTFDLPEGSISHGHLYKPEQRRVNLYYVLWIEWKDGVAYRKGLGRVLKDAWDLLDTDEIDLVLG